MLGTSPSTARTAGEGRASNLQVATLWEQSAACFKMEEPGAVNLALISCLPQDSGKTAHNSFWQNDKYHMLQNDKNHMLEAAEVVKATSTLSITSAVQRQQPA